MSHFLAACWDLDGCLVDSRHAIATALNHALVEIGLPARPVADLHRFIGPPLLETFELCLREEGDDPARAHEAIAAYRSVYPELAMRATPVWNGIPEVLTVIGEHMPMAVVTSKPRAYAHPIVEAVGLLAHFTEVYGPELHALDEPKSVKLRDALTDLGATQHPRSVLMIGDRLHDVEAGRACGTTTIGVTWGSGSREELIEAGADHLVDAPNEIPTIALGPIDQPPM